MQEEITVLPNTLLKPFGTLISCRDTIDSECIRNLTQEQCVEKCRQSPFCACGYYIQPKKGKSYCVPLNSVLLKNMNLHLNTFPLEKEPTKELWKSSAVFFRPGVYPLEGNETSIIMQKDICHLIYMYKGTRYYMQNDLSFRKDGKVSGIKVLFISKYPQFYELANIIQNNETFVLKVFAEPKVLTVVDNKFGIAPYLTLSGEQDIPDLSLYIPSKDNKQEETLETKVLSFSSEFQILTNYRTSFFGVVKEDKDKIELGVLPFPTGKPPDGFFMVEREKIQPNIYKVAEILPARLVFLRDSIDFSTLPSSKIFMFFSICFILVLLCFVLWKLLVNYNYK